MLSPSAGPTCTDLDVTKATQEVPKVTNPSTEGFVFFFHGIIWNRSSPQPIQLCQELLQHIMNNYNNCSKPATPQQFKLPLKKKKKQKKKGKGRIQTFHGEAERATSVPRKCHFLREMLSNLPGALPAPLLPLH